jgi:RNA polymerase sigma-70 factor (ECF subfamily)
VLSLRASMGVEVRILTRARIKPHAVERSAGPIRQVRHERIGHHQVTGGGAAAAAEADRRHAFQLLADRDLNRAYRIAGVILGNGQDAEDATHDAVVLAWRSFARLRDPSLFEAWFRRILVNVCRDRLRKHRRTPITELTLAGSVSVPGGFSNVDDRLVLDHAFARLSPDQAITVVLRFHADLTLEGVADSMGVPVGTVKSRLHSALAAMQLALTGPEVVET